jgi:alpha,alpha-trehalose phosphorylase
MFRSRTLMVEVNHERARYSLLAGDPLEISHHGERVTVNGDTPLELEIPALRARPAPSQPSGRAPAKRRPPR